MVIERRFEQDMTLVGKKVLIVDDDFAMCELFRMCCFEIEGCETTTAGNGQEALRFLGDPRLQFDLLVVDKEMPQLDGPGLIKTIRNGGGQLARYKTIPIIMVSGRFTSDGSAHYEAQQTMADTGFRKPLELKNLTGAAKTLLGNCILAPKTG